jgi:hypothetical protein
VLGGLCLGWICTEFAGAVWSGLAAGDGRRPVFEQPRPFAAASRAGAKRD